MPTKHNGTYIETTALNAYIKLIRSSESILHYLSRILDAEGLTLTQFAVLEAIHHLGPMSQVDIGKKILKSGGNITHVIDKLEKKGKIKRKKNEEDRRYYIVALTKEGDQLIRRYFPEHLKSIVSVMSVLNEFELNILGSLCKKLGTNLPV